MTYLICGKCGSKNIDVEDVGLTCKEHIAECLDCRNKEQGLFEECD